MLAVLSASRSFVRSSGRFSIAVAVYRASSVSYTLPPSRTPAFVGSVIEPPRFRSGRMLFWAFFRARRESSSRSRWFCRSRRYSSARSVAWSSVVSGSGMKKSVGSIFTGSRTGTPSRTLKRSSAKMYPSIAFVTEACAESTLLVARFTSNSRTRPALYQDRWRDSSTFKLSSCRRRLAMPSCCCSSWK